MSGKVEMLRSGLSASPPGCGAPCAAASPSCPNDSPASAVADNCIVSRRDIFIAILPRWSLVALPAQIDGHADDLVDI
jgi:hypothetical protein